MSVGSRGGGERVESQENGSGHGAVRSLPLILGALGNWRRGDLLEDG